MREGINIPLIFFLSIVGCLMVAITAFVVEGFYNFEAMRWHDIRRDQATYEKLNPPAYANDKTQLAHLDGASGMPIAAAMAAVADDPQAVIDPRTTPTPTAQ